MIELRKLTFEYSDGTRIFENIDWSVQAGEAWSVLGPSGCGKTTLLYLLAGLRMPTEGSILIAGEELERPRPQTGLILQDYGLLPWATIRENAMLGLRMRGFYGPDGKHAPEDEVVQDSEYHVDSWLERMGLSSVADQYPGQVSGGQRQRTAIARTLSLNPDLLLMDEPFASVDAPTRETLQDLILELRAERDLTTIVVTHAIEEAALLGKKILLLGSIPNRDVRIFSNPQAGQGSFRASSEYNKVCSQLRNNLEQVP